MHEKLKPEVKYDSRTQQLSEKSKHGKSAGYDLLPGCCKAMLKDIQVRLHNAHQKMDGESRIPATPVSAKIKVS